MSDGTGRYAVPSHAASLLDVRAKRREAYQSQRSGWGSCGRRYGAAFFLVDVVLCPVFALFSVFRQLLRLWWKSFTAWLSCMDCHFFLGALAAVLLCAWTAWQSCDAPEPHLERHLRLVCSFESPLASQAWELLKSTSSSLTLHWVWFVASLQEIEHRVALLLLQGRCPFRDLDEAQQACQSRPDLVLLRRAPDNHALRKAYHDGQRQVHPDLLRLQHPACAAELLQACSVALNLAFDTRRHELNCPGAR
ncbi:Pre-mRNA-processing factor 17 [Durusdinium trenchii]|uniref:Pre-mRNA-processing factor 17 n=1 Tax=Durusdinium trenchii TaxID=1381693 RepID=A0ABP0N2J1_9DINO